MTMLRIRPFAESDRVPLRLLFLESRRKAFHWLDPAQFYLEDFDKSTEGERIWVAEIAGEVVGFAAVWEEEIFLHSLFIAPAHQGQGVGSALLNACLAELGRPVRLKCKQQNTPALEFYARRGWTIDSEGVGPEGEFFMLRYDERVYA